MIILNIKSNCFHDVDNKTGSELTIHNAIHSRKLEIFKIRLVNEMHINPGKIVNKKEVGKKTVCKSKIDRSAPQSWVDYDS